MTAEVARLERAWRHAQSRVEGTAHPSDEATRAADLAWDAYTTACDDAEVCTHPGCYAPSPDHALCTAHRLTTEGNEPS